MGRAPGGHTKAARAKPRQGQSWEVDSSNRVLEMPLKSQNQAVLKPAPPQAVKPTLCVRLFCLVKLA